MTSSPPRPKTFLIACGGTGGHLAPGIALAESLSERGHECELVISDKQVDARLLSKYSRWKAHTLPGSGFSFKPALFLKFFLNLWKGFWKAWRLHQQTQPDALIAFGGFACVAISLTCYGRKTPIILHESNRRTGKAIRLLSHIACRLYLPEGSHLEGSGKAAVRFCGLPLRKEIHKHNKAFARGQLGMDKGKGKLLLVVGGSQGAKSFNHWAREHMERLARENINLYCITGEGGKERKIFQRQSRKGESVRLIFTPFCDHMALVMSAADLVIARAGSGSISEFTACELPSILSPHPNSADEHQRYNALILQSQGGGLMLPEKNLKQFYKEVVQLIHNDRLLAKFKKNLSHIKRTNPRDFMVKDIEQVLNRESPPCRESPHSA